MLSVETDAKGPQAVHMKGGPLPWLVRWACRAGARDICPALAPPVCSSRPCIKHFFLVVHYFTLFVPNTHQAGPAVLPGRPSLCLSLMHPHDAN